MTLVEIDRLLGESGFSAAADLDADLQDLRLAILLEDAYGVTLTDDQISGLRLRDHESLALLLSESNCGP